MSDDVTVVDGARLRAEIEDGRVSIAASAEEGTLRVRTDPDQLIEGFPVAEIRLAGDGVEASIHLTADAVDDVLDALQEVRR